MARLPQSPPPGVFRNATPEATSGKWYDVNLVRFRGGQIQPIGGNVLQPSAWADSPPRDLLTWHDNKHVRWAAYGSNTKLYAYRFDTQTNYDITPAGIGPLDPPGASTTGYGMGDYGMETYGTAREATDIGPSDIAGTMGDIWSMDTFGEDLLVVPTQDGRLFRWSPLIPDTPAVLVAAAPDQNRGVIVTDQRHVVLLGAGGDPRMIAWSDQENPDVWTPDVVNLAGSKLLQTQAVVLCARKASDGILIFTSNDVHKMAYVGTPYAYGIVQIATGCGPLSLRAVVAIGSYMAWPGINAFWAYASGVVQPIPCDVQDWFYSLLNRDMRGRVWGSPNPAFSEIWWDWPDEGSLETNRYLAVNYAENPRPWTIGERMRTAGDPSGTMDYPVLGGAYPTGGALYLHEYGWTEDGYPRGPSGQIYAESGNIVMGEGDTRFSVTQLVFDADPTEGRIGYRFFTREQPADAASEHDTGLFTEIHDGLMDMKFSGRSIRMRMEALEDGPFAVGRPRLEVKAAGNR